MNQGAAGPVPVYRVNCGGGGVIDPAGDLNWHVDTNVDPAPWRSAGGAQIESNLVDPVVSTSPTIPADTPDEIFQTGRFDFSGDVPPELAYTFPVIKGKIYTVRIYLAETYFMASGNRVFSIDVDGSTPPVFTNVDKYDLSGGKMYGYVVSSNFTAATTSMVVSLVRATENPAIQAVELLRLD